MQQHPHPQEIKMKTRMKIKLNNIQLLPLNILEQLLQGPLWGRPLEIVWGQR